MSEPTRHQPSIHLIGSVPLPDVETVFRRVSQAFGPHLKRLPDGETGRRAGWISFIRELLLEHPAIEEDTSRPPFRFTQWDGGLVFEIPLLKFRDGTDTSRVTFETGYAEDAIRNFAIFERLQNEGVIPQGVKYQACCATPLAISYLFMSPDARATFTPVYTQHLIDEVKRVAASLPHEKLSYQWDVAPEVLMWEGYFEQPPNYKEEIFTSLAEVGNAVPETIEMGYHLCYGSPRDEHVVQPKDLGNAVEMLNGIFARLQRPVQFVHVPVPQDRQDDAYFAPLDNLRLPQGTEFYLGCVHPDDAVGNAGRLAKAQTHTLVSGVSSECGWGRGAPDNLPAILDAHTTLVEHAGA